MVGKIDYNETKLSYITAWVAGRLDKLYVDYTGIYVNKGGHLVHMYSPELISAQEELLQAVEAAKTTQQWLGYGQKVEFTTVSYPGETFGGTISFIDPILDEKTRTVKVRVNVNNPDGKLKPGMFVKATVHSDMAEART
jgi:multidrug efflux pump subunit AcrA (membrane-fusion protein)